MSRPARKDREGRGWRLNWTFESPITGQPIAVVLAIRLNPGPLAARSPCFACVQAGTAQPVFLAPFGYAFLFQGYTGLTVTVGSVTTLFVLMQATARVDWSGVFAGRAAGSRQE